jgi:hypothetical protein
MEADLLGAWSSGSNSTAVGSDVSAGLLSIISRTRATLASIARRLGRRRGKIR